MSKKKENGKSDPLWDFLKLIPGNLKQTTPKGGVTVTYGSRRGWARAVISLGYIKLGDSAEKQIDEILRELRDFIERNPTP